MLGRSRYTEMTLGWCTVAGLCLALSTTGADAALIHHWDFDEPDGQGAPQVDDNVGSSHGTFDGPDDSSRLNDTPGNQYASGRSLTFNGTSENLDLASPTEFEDTDDFSLNLWYKGTQAGAGGVPGYTLLGDETSALFAQLALRDGKVSYVHYDGGWQYSTTSGTVNDGNWHMITLVVDGASQTCDIYIDGVVDLVDGSSSIDNCCASDNEFRVNSLMKGPTFAGPLYTAGRLDDVRIYNHEISQAEIDALMADGLVHHWDFDEADGQSSPEVDDVVGLSEGTFSNMDDTNRSGDNPGGPYAAGRSLIFNGSDENLDVVQILEFEDTDDFSLNLWYKGTQAGAGGVPGYTLLGDETSALFAQLALIDGKVAYVRYDGVWDSGSITTSTINDGTWHMVTLVVDGDTQTGDIYIDGVVDLVNGSTSIDNCCLGDNEFRVNSMMKGPGFGPGHTSGKLDEVRIYNRELTPDEIAALFVPAPATLALLAIGGLIGLLSRKRRH